MFGRKYMGVVRTTFLIGSDGRIARVWNKVKVPGHASQVLDSGQGALNRPSSHFPWCLRAEFPAAEHFCEKLC